MSDIIAVAGTCWGEARSLGKQGMQAVCNVIMNRVVKQTWYGLTPYEVCFKNKNNVYQFDCNNPEDPNYEKIQAITTDDPEYSIAMDLAASAVNGTLSDITSGALNYYSTTIPLPSWARNLDPCLVIGNTNFYNDVP